MSRNALLLAIFTALTAAAAGDQDCFAPPPQQPLPFSHKKHAGAGLRCTECHAMEKPGYSAGLPSTATCMTCHITIKKDATPIQRLAAYDKQHKPVPWEPVYRLPDYVEFSHADHVQKGKVECQTCHGLVQEWDVMCRETDLAMATCIDCHRAREVPVACDRCHDPR